jgi:hypothetical protein
MTSESHRLIHTSCRRYEIVLRVLSNRFKSIIDSERVYSLITNDCQILKRQVANMSQQNEKTANGCKDDNAVVGHSSTSLVEARGGPLAGPRLLDDGALESEPSELSPTRSAC